MWKHSERLPAKIQEITTRDRAVAITTKEVVAGTIREATIMVAVAISTKILGTIAVEAATEEAVVAMAPMREAEVATLTTKVAEAAITLLPSMVRAVPDMILTTIGETTTTAEATTTTEVVAAAEDRATHMKRVASPEAAKEALISTNRSLLALHLLVARMEAREAGTREEDTIMSSNSGNTQSLKVLRPQPKIMRSNSKKSEATLLSYF